MPSFRLSPCCSFRVFRTSCMIATTSGPNPFVQSRKSDFLDCTNGLHGWVPAIQEGHLRDGRRLRCARRYIAWQISPAVRDSLYFWGRNFMAQTFMYRSVSSSGRRTALGLGYVILDVTFPCENSKCGWLLPYMILSYNVTHWLALRDKHSLKDDYSFQLDMAIMIK